MPTGVHLLNARELLFDTAERVLRRDAVSGLTSRAVTSEAAVAKGVMHRHFVDFDAFLAELVLDRAAQLAGPMTVLCEAAGSGVVADNLVKALTTVFSPLAVAVPALVITRPGLRTRSRGRCPPLPVDSGRVHVDHRVPRRGTGTWPLGWLGRYPNALAHPHRGDPFALHRP